MDLSEVSSIYFIGIGGIGMSATAAIAAEAGYEVSGSDSAAIYDPAKAILDEQDISYFIGYDSSRLESQQADLYIVSAGEDMNNPEVKYLNDHDIKFYSFSELLYELAKDRIRIVVAGTHGKSTTTGLIGHILHNIDQSSFMTGAVLQDYNTNFQYSPGHYFVFEGDEYKALFDDPTPKFHYYRPDIVVLTNVDFDHPDMYANLEQMIEEFKQLITNLPDDGLIIYNADDPNLAKLVHESNVASMGFSLHDRADFAASDIIFTPELTKFTVTRFDKDGQKWSEAYQTLLAGDINIYNALAAIALLRALGFKQAEIQESLLTYKGVKRRFEKIGTTPRGAVVYDDYAHHPTAVRETLAAARTRYPTARIWAVFEPHTFSRTAAVLTELAHSFVDASEVVISEVYPAREQKTDATITGQQVAAAIKQHHSSVHFVEDKTAAVNLLRDEVEVGDVIIVMAVGSFNQLAKELTSDRSHGN
jgi:UDP-N-acetylmuramate--L-alanine ligase